MLKLRQAVPPLGVTTLDGRSWKLTDLRPDSFTMVVFYRGLHSPQCQRYVEGLADQVGALRARRRGDRDQHRRARPRRAGENQWALDRLQVGYGLSLDRARAWGLYVSNSCGVISVGIEEPGQFNEPGLFRVRADGTL